MPRPIKVGLDYFPLDVNIFANKKIKALRRAFGATGIAVYINLLCRVYANGYYYRFTSEEELAADIAEEIGNTQIRKVIASVVNVIHYLIENETIDRLFYERDGVITGKALQEQYVESAYKAKRKIELGSYQLVDVFSSIPQNNVSSEETAVNSEETRVNSEEMQQSKVKENKVKENTTTERAPARTREEERSDLLAFGIPDSYIDYFYSRIKSGKYHYSDLVTACRKWWEKDKDGWADREEKVSFKTFDPDEAFANALGRKYKN